MSRTVEIPGGTATLRDAGGVRQRDRRRLESASVFAAAAVEKIQQASKGIDPRELRLAEVGLTREEFDSLYEMQDATILAYLADWTLGIALPKTAEDLNELPVELYDALRTVTASDGADTLAPVDFSEGLEPERPTGDSSDSDGSLRDSPEPASTTIPPSDGESTPTESSSEG